MYKGINQKKIEMKPQIIKGAMTFMLEELDRLSPQELHSGLKDIFGWPLTPKELYRSLGHLQDRNIISIIENSDGTEYKIRKANYSELEASQVRDIIATDKIFKRKFEQWRDKVFK